MVPINEKTRSFKAVRKTINKKKKYKNKTNILILNKNQA